MKLMLKIALLTFALMLFSIQISFCQSFGIPDFSSTTLVIDTAKFSVKYKLTWVSNDKLPQNKDNDFIILDIGNYLSKSYSKIVFIYDSNCSILVSRGAENLPSPVHKADPIEIYKYNSTKKTIVIHRVDELVFKYEDNDINFNWREVNEKRTIQGYNCQKAITNFRGRNYEAWFTKDIPISDGPWKFQSLPGLILRINDSENQFVFECISITKPTNKLITYRNFDVLETTRVKCNDFIKQRNSDLAAYLNSKGINLTVEKKNGKTESNPKYSIPYNPIELE